MTTKCTYCSKQFNTQAALNWHLQKDKVCLGKRSKSGKNKSNRSQPAQVGQFTHNPTYDEKANWSTVVELPQSQLPPHPQSNAKYRSMARQVDNLVPPSAQKKMQTQPPPIPPKHKRVSSKTDIDFADVAFVANEVAPSQSADNSIAALQSQLEALKETNSKLMHDKMNYADEVNALKVKIMKQDEELHRWKDKLLTKKEKLVGEDLKNELITLILDSELNIDQVPDDVERQIYGFLLDKLASNRGVFTKLFCCK